MSEPTSVAIPDMTAHTDAQADSHGGDAAPGAPNTPAPARSRRHPTRGRLWVVGAVLVGAFAFLLVEGLGSSLNYFETVDQAIQHKATLGTQTFRLEGVVSPAPCTAARVASISWPPGPCTGWPS